MLFKSILALNLFEDEDLKMHAGYVLPGEDLYVTELKTVRKGECSIKIGLTEEKRWATLSCGEFYFADTEKCCICLDTQCDLELTHCCSNVFHKDCLEAQIKSKWPTKLINFRYLDCPLCHVPLKHEKLEKVLEEHREFEKKISELREVQLEKEPLESEKDKHAFFMCETCDRPFCGGKVDCARDIDLDKKKMICKDCEWNAPRSCKDHRCFIHGKNFAQFKCDSCCSIASWDCINNHYCERCHKKAHHEKDFPCLGPDKCPLGIAHPPNHRAKHGTDYITGFVIGCIKCIDPEAQGDHNYSGTGDLIWDSSGKKDIKKLNNRKVINLFSYEAPKAFSLPTDFSPINPKVAIEKLEKTPPKGLQKFKDMLQKLKIPRLSVLCAMKRCGIKYAEKRIKEIEPVNLDGWIKNFCLGVTEEEIKKEMLLWDYNPEETFEKMRKKRQQYLEKYLKRLNVGVPREVVLRDVKKDKSYVEKDDIAYIEKKFKEHEDAKNFEKKLDKYVKMLKVKTPEAAVLQEMRLDGISDENMLKEAFKKVLQKSGKADLKKYIKMYKFKIPPAAIKGRMRMDRVDENLFSEVVEAANKNLAKQVGVKERVKQFNSLKALYQRRSENRKKRNQGPPHKVRPRKQRLQPKKDFNPKSKGLLSAIRNGAKLKKPTVPQKFEKRKMKVKKRQMKVKKKSKLTKYERLIKLNAPRASIENRMRMDGLDPKEFENLFEPIVQNVPEIQVGLKRTPEKKKSIPKELLRFAKMLKIGIPPQAVRNKMKMDGFDEKRILEIEVAKSPFAARSPNFGC